MIPIPTVSTLPSVPLTKAGTTEEKAHVACEPQQQRAEDMLLSAFDSLWKVAFCFWEAARHLSLCSSHLILKMLWSPSPWAATWLYAYAAATENRRSVTVPAFGSLYRRQLFDRIMDVLQRKDQIRFVVLSESGSSILRLLMFQYCIHSTVLCVLAFTTALVQHVCMVRCFPLWLEVALKSTSPNSLHLSPFVWLMSECDALPIVPLNKTHTPSTLQLSISHDVLS